MSENKKFGMGANPPPSLAWQMGKTAASIDFVKNAEDMILWLQFQIEAVKKGDVVLYDEVRINVSGWEEATEKPTPIEQACDSLILTHLDGDNVFSCGIGMENGEEVIVVQVVDASRANLPEKHGGFKVVVKESERPTPCENTE